MDRFIAINPRQPVTVEQSLKSNMDRFIEEKIFEKAERKNSLKSNIDRFIEAQNVFVEKRYYMFKIQYG